jgi:hypothetical protein
MKIFKHLCSSNVVIDRKLKLKYEYETGYLYKIWHCENIVLDVKMGYPVFSAWKEFKIA